MEYIDISNSIIALDTRQQSFDLKQVKNRRFMYSSKHHTLILGGSEDGRRITSTHAQEFHQIEVNGCFDDYIRGWIGQNSSDYKQGIIHFAPYIHTDNMDEGISCLVMFLKAKGFGRNSKIRGFNNVPECPISELFPSLVK